MHNKEKKEKGKMKERVCVTGSSGYIASWLVKLLLKNGYIVHATVRNLSDPSKVAHLKALEGAEERLHLFEANLLEEGSFDAAVDGCDGVFHTASPVILDNVNDPKAELIEPAVEGTLNVLKSCAKVLSIRRVVLTSSMATVMLRRTDPQNSTDVIIDETWYSDPVFSEEIKQWYILSKILAEEAARIYAEENGIELLVINPSLVIGPLLQPILNYTSNDFLNFIKHGKCSAMPGGILVYIDVRDVAAAHILAFENPNANGRYCVVAGVLNSSQVFNILRELYPKLILPNNLGENEVESIPFKISNEKVKSLGVNFIPVEHSLKDTVESLKERNLISFSM